jgi:hypothetical protein
MKKELQRLETGTAAEKSRFRNFIDAIRQVKQNPLLHKYKKTLPEDYKAVHALPQYVAFFKLYHLKSGNVIFFVWMNDEDSIHANESRGDAYQVFRKMVEAGEVEILTEPTEEQLPKFKMDGKWGDPFRHVRYDVWPDSRAALALILYQVNPLDYRIDSITTTNGDWEIASDLFVSMLREVDANRVRLNMTVRKTHDDYSSIARLLTCPRIRDRG